jgi:SAM-dependent methyltransferase
MDKTEKNFPKWESLYEEAQVETMPWFHPSLDPDLEKTLITLGIESGSFLDLGTGPATQAIELAKKGFRVTATDVSGAAIERAHVLAKEMGLTIDFRRDDILETDLETPFDFVFDRGCFHTFVPNHRDTYLRAIAKLVKKRGFLFLKCFSHDEPMEDGPYRFSPDEINALFSSIFEVVSIEKTVYQGTLDPLPRAFFCIMKRK